MLSSLNTNTSNIYNIMSHQSAAVSNADSNKAASIGADMQQSIQETESAREKGGMDGYKEALHKINLLV